MSVTFGLVISVQFLSGPCFIRWIPWFLRLHIFFVFHCAGNLQGWVTAYFLWSVSKCSANEGEGGDAGSKNAFVGVRTKLFWRAIYFFKPRKNHRSQSSSLSCRGIGRQNMQIMQEYNLMTTIVIRTLTQPRMCERGFSSFFTMIQLKLSPFLRMQPIEGKSGRKYPLFVAMLTVFILFYMILKF